MWFLHDGTLYCLASGELAWHFKNHMQGWMNDLDMLLSCFRTKMSVSTPFSKPNGEKNHTLKCSISVDLGSRLAPPLMSRRIFDGRDKKSCFSEMAAPSNELRRDPFLSFLPSFLPWEWRLRFSGAECNVTIEWERERAKPSSSSLSLRSVHHSFQCFTREERSCLTDSPILRDWERPPKGTKR